MMAEDRTLDENEDEDEEERVEHDELSHVDVRDADSCHDEMMGQCAGNSSYVESTALLDDLNNVLGVDDDEEGVNLTAIKVRMVLE